MTISHLDLTQDPIELTKALVDIPSPSHHEEAIADAIEQALKPLEAAGVELARFGNTVCARTN
ncbi:MAG: succinyl-diaminopimelate desuccinylase, partial [Corynebacterium casei]